MLICSLIIVSLQCYNFCSRFIKAALLPHLKKASTWETKLIADLNSPKFFETFYTSIPEHKVRDKTLQVNLWSKHDIHEECLVSNYLYLEN